MYAQQHWHWCMCPGRRAADQLTGASSLDLWTMCMQTAIEVVKLCAAVVLFLEDEVLYQ